MQRTLLSICCPCQQITIMGTITSLRCGRQLLLRATACIAGLSDHSLTLPQPRGCISRNALSGQWRETRPAQRHCSRPTMAKPPGSAVGQLWSGCLGPDGTTPVAQQSLNRSRQPRPVSAGVRVPHCGSVVHGIPILYFLDIASWSRRTKRY